MALMDEEQLVILWAEVAVAQAKAVGLVIQVVAVLVMHKWVDC